MKSKTIWIIVGVIVLLVVLYLIYRSTNKTTSTTTSTTAATNVIPPRTTNSGVQRFMQVFNPYPQEYLNQFPNPELIRTVNGNGFASKEVFVGSNYGTLKCPKGQVVCTRDPNSCCQLIA